MQPGNRRMEGDMLAAVDAYKVARDNYWYVEHTTGAGEDMRQRAFRQMQAHGDEASMYAAVIQALKRNND